MGSKILAIYKIENNKPTYLSCITKDLLEQYADFYITQYKTKTNYVFDIHKKIHLPEEKKFKIILKFPNSIFEEDISFYYFTINRRKLNDFIPNLKRSSVCCIMVDDEILLLERLPKDEVLSGWCLPGGKKEKGEDDMDAAIRETNEETGIDIPYPHYVSDCISGTHAFMVAVFYIQLDTKPVVTKSKEHKSYKWIKISDLHNYQLAGNTRIFINDVLNKIESKNDQK